MTRSAVGVLVLLLGLSLSESAWTATYHAEPKVMFYACTPGHPAGPGMFVADSDFANPVRLTSADPNLPNLEVNSLEVNSPGSASGCDVGGWSPDGTRAAVSRNMYLYLLDLTALIEHPGQQPTALRDRGGRMIPGASPNWSPDGELILFHNVDGVAAIRPDGTGYRLLAAMAYTVRQPEWSPDGRSVAFKGGEAAGADLYVVEDVDRPRVGKVRQLTHTANNIECWPHWSPDSQAIVFTRCPYGKESEEGDVWLLDMATGEEVQLTDTPDLAEQAMGWSPFDNKIYYRELAEGINSPKYIVRMYADGGGVERLEREVIPAGKITWALTGAWIDGVNALPGEQVRAKVGVQDAEDLAEVAADVAYTGCCNTVDIAGAVKGPSIEDWMEEAPAVEYGTISLHAWSRASYEGAVSGPAHLFDIQVSNMPEAVAGDIQLLTFEELHLEDALGRSLSRVALAGGVHTIPFASLHLTIVSKRVLGNGDIALRIRVSALDRDGSVMEGYNGPVRLGTHRAYEDYWRDWNVVVPASPETVELHAGMWAGRVLLRSPEPGAVFLVYAGDIGMCTEPVIAAGR